MNSFLSILVFAESNFAVQATLGTRQSILMPRHTHTHTHTYTQRGTLKDCPPQMAWRMRVATLHFNGPGYSGFPAIAGKFLSSEITRLDMGNPKLNFSYKAMS